MEIINAKLARGIQIDLDLCKLILAQIKPEADKKDQKIIPIKRVMAIQGGAEYIFKDDSRAG